MNGVGATVRAVGSGATLEPTVVPPVPVVVEEQVARETLVPVKTAALLQDMRAHLSLKLGVATGPTELVSTVCMPALQSPVLLKWVQALVLHWILRPISLCKAETSGTVAQWSYKINGSISAT